MKEKLTNLLFYAISVLLGLLFVLLFPVFCILVVKIFGFFSDLYGEWLAFIVKVMM